MTNKKRLRPRTPEVCPVCGEEVRRDALACSQCGADHNSGDDFVKQEFGSQAKPAGLKTIWWIVGIALIVAFVLYFSAAH